MPRFSPSTALWSGQAVLYALLLGAWTECGTDRSALADQAVPPPPLAPDTTFVRTWPNERARTDEGLIGTVPELPRVQLNTELPAVTGRRLWARAGQSLQTAIDSARIGDEIVLEPGVTYTGPFVLRRKTAGSGWLTIRSAGALPAPGTRARPTDAARMPRLVARNAADRVLTAEPGAHHYRLIGLEVTVASPTETAGPTALIEFGVGGSAQDTHAKQPSHIVLDRMYVHGTPVLDVRSCIRLQSAHTAVIDSWISDCHAKGFDSQAISGYNGSGPFKIVNNFLEGAGENVMFGGADSRAEELLPQDIEIRGNHFYKPPSWRGGPWLVKNLFELKVGKRVLVEGNVFENNWSHGQTGFAVNLKSVNQSGRAPWSETSDVTFRYNIVRNSEQGITLHRRPEGRPAVPMSRLLFEHNVFERLGTTGDFGGGGRLFTASGIDDLTIRHNTAISTHSAVVLTGVTMQRLVIAHNVFSATRYGIVGDGRGYGTRALNNRAAPGWIFQDNVMVGGSTRRDPPGNRYPASGEPRLDELHAALGLERADAGRRPSAAAVPTDARAGADLTGLGRRLRGVVVAPGG